MPFLSVPFILSIFLVFVRVGALVGTAPYFSSGSFPVRIKVFLALALSMILFPVIPSQTVTLTSDMHTLKMVLLIIQELLVGAAMGLTGQIIFGGLQMAGQLISVNTGLAFASVVDPVNQSRQSIISQLFGLLGILVFLGMNGDQYFIQALAKSFDIVPIGAAHVTKLAPTFLKMAVYLFLVGVQMAAPFLIVLFLLDMCFAIFARVMPQANIFFISLPLKLGVGFILLLLILPYAPTAFRHFFEQLWQYLDTILHTLTA